MIYRNPRLLLIVLLLGGLGAKAYTYHVRAVEGARSSVIQEYSREYVQDLEEQVSASRRLQTETNNKVEILNAEKLNISKSYSALLASLQQRPSRSEPKQSTPGDACPTPSYTGASLYREDGEFLAGEASRAEVVLKERNFYYEQYNSVKNELDKLNGKDRTK